MEEQKNLNNPPVNQPEASTAPKGIPTAAGAMIILIVAVLVGVGIFYFLQTSENPSDGVVIPNKSLKTKTETADTKEDIATSQTPVVEETIPQPAAGSTFNFDYELKKLDDQNNSISSDDFNETEMSDANIGI